MMKYGMDSIRSSFSLFCSFYFGGLSVALLYLYILAGWSTHTHTLTLFLCTTLQRLHTRPGLPIKRLKSPANELENTDHYPSYYSSTADWIQISSSLSILPMAVPHCLPRSLSRSLSNRTLTLCNLLQFITDSRSITRQAVLGSSRRVVNREINSLINLKTYTINVFLHAS